MTGTRSSNPLPSSGESCKPSVPHSAKGVEGRGSRRLARFGRCIATTWIWARMSLPARSMRLGPRPGPAVRGGQFCFKTMSAALRSTKMKTLIPRASEGMPE